MERNTRQRGAIRRAFQRANRPLSVQEVLAIAGREVGRLGISTVYRNIRALMDESWLEIVELPGDVTCYEVRGKDHHHYFQCRRCHRVFDVPGCLASLGDTLPQGFTVEGHELVLYGACAGCAED